VEAVEERDHQVPHAPRHEKHDRAAKFEGDNTELGQRHESGHTHQEVGQPRATPDDRPSQRRAGQPLQSAEAKLGPGRQEVRRDDRQLRHAQRPAAPLGQRGIAVSCPTRGGQYGQGDQQAKPVVVDLAVAHRDDHPLEVERENGPSEQAVRAAGGRRERGHQQEPEDDLNDRGCGRG
jgi:hypothetical protein